MRAKFVFEKFTEKSDPIKDLGIGVPDWDNLTPGTILQAKTDIGLDSYMRFNNQSSYVHIPKGGKVTIMHLKYNWVSNKLYVNTAAHSMLATIQQFKNRFDIVGHTNIKESVNEKFKQDSDPIKDLGIGYSKSTLDSKSFKILQFIGSKGKEGASLTEIQHFIWTELDGYSEESFWITSAEKNTREWNTPAKQRATRGHWNTQLFGGMHYHEGLLHKYCEKSPITKKWVLKRLSGTKEKMYDWPKYR